MTEMERKLKLNEIIERINNGSCQVLGAGVSNVPLVRWLSAKGARVVVRDMKEREKIDSADELSALGAELITGVGYLDGLDSLPDPERAVIFRSPGMRPDIKEISDAAKKGALLTSEIELFLLLTPSRVIAITGSDGKTTTTTLVGRIMDFCVDGRVYVGGNIGTPLLPVAESMTEKDVAVVELSSFQLQTFDHSCNTAVITNITPNHLNWHTDMDEYTESKYNVFSKGGCKRLVVNSDNEGSLNAARRAVELGLDLDIVYFSMLGDSYDSTVPEFANEGAVAIYLKDGKITVGTKNGERAVLNAADIKIPGDHNVANYMTAIGACLDDISDFSRVEKLAKEFGGVAHRLELVRMFDGVKYYNSSIDSTPTRTRAALSALKESPIVICGGADKGVSFLPLAEALCQRAKAVVLTGACRDKILAAFDELDGSYIRPEIFVCPDFTEAVEKAREIASTGDTVLLSPACTSFDAFRNFEERGNTFRKIVNSF